MTDSMTPEGGGWTIRCGTHWETWHQSRLAAERAITAHKTKCKEVSPGGP